MTGSRILVAIPCKNEAETITSVIGRIPGNIAGVSALDVLVIDDGSSDDTAQQAKDAGARVIRHRTNRGLGEAFRTASHEAVVGGYDALVTIDGDGQFAPEQIPLLLEPVLSGEADAATGSRFCPGASVDGITPAKRWGNRQVARIVSHLSGGRYDDVSCGFRCYGREALLRMNLHGRFTNTHETFLALAANQMRIVEVPIEVRYFDGRVSRIASSLPRYALRTVSIMARWYRDHRPLRFFWGLAGISATVGTGFSALIIWHYLTTGRFSGFIFAGLLGGFFYLVSLLLLLGGLLADMMMVQRTNQERLMYLMRQKSS